MQSNTQREEGAWSCLYLAHRNAHAVAAEVAETENALTVGDHNRL